MPAPTLCVGRATIHFLNDGFWHDDGGAMFGVVPRDLWGREKPANERNRIRMSLCCPLVVDGREVVLVDTGLGTRLSPREEELYLVERAGGIAGELARLGLTPADVTHVVLSHLHFDHCGGVIARQRNGTWRPAFPRARYFIQRREWEVARAPRHERLAAAYRHAEQCLEPLAAAGLVELVDGAVQVTASVRTLPAGGHTPAHQCVVVESEGAGFVHLADLAPTTSHLRPAWTMAYDVDPLETVETKSRLLADIRQRGWWVSLDHDDRVAAGRLTGRSLGPEALEGELLLV